MSPEHRKIRTTALAVVALLAAGLVLGAVLMFLSGWRWFIVSTPSMGESAPVGTLVVSQPITGSALHTGDVITFTPPGRSGTVYTHRIMGIDSSGGITTRGDINGAADPWVLTSEHVLGRAILLPGWGWLIRSLPLLLAGAALIETVIRLWIRGPWRRPVRLLGACAVMSLTSVLVHPFIGLTLLEVTTDGTGTRASVASTGLLPVTVRAEHGTTAHLASGQTGELTVNAGEGYYYLSSSVNLPWWGWIITVLICLLPILWVLGSGRFAGPEPDELHRLPE